MKTKNCSNCGDPFDSTGNAKYCMKCRSISRRTQEQESRMNQYYSEWLDRTMALEERVTKMEEMFEVVEKWARSHIDTNHKKK